MENLSCGEEKEARLSDGAEAAGTRTWKRRLSLERDVT